MDKVFPGPFIQSPGSMYWPLFLNLQLCRSSGVSSLLFSNTVHVLFFFFFQLSVFGDLYPSSQGPGPFGRVKCSPVLYPVIPWFLPWFFIFVSITLEKKVPVGKRKERQKRRKEANKGKEPTYNSGLELQWKKTSSTPMGRSCILANPSY